MHTTHRLSPLWAACALPGDGPEYRFTAAPPRNPIRALRTRVRSRRARKEVTR